MVKFEQHQDIVLSSRTRLARNIEHYPFPEWAGSRQLEDIKKDISAFSTKLKLKLFDYDKLTRVQRQVFVEKHLASPQFVNHEGNGKAILVNKNESVSIMVNEEDHLRIQCIKENMDLDNCYKNVDKIDDVISAELPFAFGQNLGFYTACPTNLGTALRASIMMHLPAVVLTKRIYPLVKTLNEKGISVRGMFGEGTVAFGNTFQISNQRTLGVNEKQILASLKSGYEEVVKQEMTCRKNLLRRDRVILKDKVERAVGILKHAVILSFEEALELISTLKLGIALDLYKGRSKLKKLNDLTTKIQAAHISIKAKKELNEIDEKKARANLIRKEIGLN